MKHIFILIGFLLNCNETLALQKHETIPEIFQGYWASDIQNCETNHPYNLYISPKVFQLWESSGVAELVATKNKNEIAIIAEFSGEGQQWIGFMHFSLSSDYSKLIDISDPYSKEQLVRLRCPKKL